MAEPTTQRKNAEDTRSSAPSISLPKGGGAIRGIGEKFDVTPTTGTGKLTVPVHTSPGRSGFGPQLALWYDSGSGNSPFGVGWSLSVPSITRKTDKGLPRYRDAEDSDVFLLSDAEDLVPVLQDDGSRFEDAVTAPGFTIHRYRPRVESLFARIERWTGTASGDIHWRTITRDNVTVLYGQTPSSRIGDPSDDARIFSWLISESYDDKGNATLYEYASENDENVDRMLTNERNRVSTANRYIKRIKYGNRVSRLVDADLAAMEWLFEVVFDYGESHYDELDPDPDVALTEQFPLVRASVSGPNSWPARPDPFSSYRAGFEVRTYRRCRRVLMFHRFPELAVEPYLVSSTEFDYGDFDYSGEADIDVELAHQGSTRFASFIRAITHSGFVRDETRPAQIINGATYRTYIKKSLPSIEVEYSKAVIQDDVRRVDPASAENLPTGIDGRTYRWVDLDGEGVSSILTDQASGWLYKPNLGSGRFGPLTNVGLKPSLAEIASGTRQEFVDLSGDGQLDVASFSGSTPGFYERTLDGDWEPFKTFLHLPNIVWHDPNLRFVDLNGDGHSDVLITEHQVFTWYPSLGEKGFGPAERVRPPVDEEQGPQLVLSDNTFSIYLADMSGDGLSDLVRVRNGEICYWPNLGYGRFGSKVTMDASPRFDGPDQFDQRRVRLADIDGSGVTDIVYLGRDGVRLYFNQSGNRWSGPRRLPFPFPDSFSSVAALDLLGNGTICLVWSSPLPNDATSPLRFVDLMGQKPHLLTRVFNNLGAETRVEYVSSTKFYLADKAAGKPWITRLPFPVHVVERVETYDRVSGNRFVARYAYHHGYFDGVEREFRGFGMVEQFDTEEFAALNEGELPTGSNVETSSHVPPIRTLSWFHTGAYIGRDHISNFYAGLLDEDDKGEYYREPGLTDDEARELLLDDTVLPEGLSADEEREACRALKGRMLRREVYADDRTAKAPHPYTVTEQNFTVRRLQPRFGNRASVFLALPRESITYDYDRNTNDPQVSHDLTLEVNDFGNVLKSAAIRYGRRHPDLSLDPLDRAKQSAVSVIYTENEFTNSIDEAGNYRTPLVCEARTYELTGYAPTGSGNRYAPSDLVQPSGSGLVLSFDNEIQYEQSPGAGRQRRLIEHIRTYYRRNNLTDRLPLSQVESLALPFNTYRQAFTAGLVAEVYDGRTSNAMFQDDGRYVHSEGDSNWWLPSGQVFYSLNSADTAAQELNFALQHFFISHRYRDPFHTDALPTETTVTYDSYDLLVLETRDPMGNRVTVGERDAADNLTVSGNDYRVLGPRLVMDPNRNRTEVAFDALGMVVGTAVMGKPNADPVEGDSLNGFESDLTEAAILLHLADPLLNPQTILQRATTRLVYDLFAYQRTKSQPNPQPAVVYTLARETHESDPVPVGGLKIQHSFSYSDGFGREIQKKTQAERGSVPQRDVNGEIIIGADGQPVVTLNDVGPRWVGNGWTVFNNKGKAVRQYEPFFTDTHRFEFEVKIGVSSVVFYDPVERVVATVRPNHTWGKVVFDPWRQEAWDLNDTVLIADPKTDPDAGDFFSRLPDADYLPTWSTQREAGALGPQEQAAARKAAIHAATPTIVHADSLGRAFLTVSHNKSKYSDTLPDAPPVEEFSATRVELDIEGNQRVVRDAIVQSGDQQGRIVMRYDYDMLGNRIHQASMEAGERWILNDIAGKPLYSWDSRDHRFRTAYDQLRRPTDSFLSDAGGTELLVGRTIYGETQVNPEAGNLRGKVVQHFDQAGVGRSDEFDFKGNLVRSQRQLAALVGSPGMQTPAYKTTVDWSNDVQLENAAYTSRTSYDALNRPTQLIAPHSDQLGSAVNLLEQIYNEANLLQEVHVWLNQNAEPDGWLDPVTADLHAVTNIDYDAKGQRTLIQYGNDTETRYRYDLETFRLVNLYTRRGAAFTDDCDNPQPPPATIAAPEIPPPSTSCGLQNLSYTYDPAGNITYIRDDAQQTIYFRNKRVEPSCEYTYDGLNRLIEATGREHLGQIGGAPITHSYNDFPRVGVLSGNGAGRFAPNDGNAMGTYLERYTYDATGNFREMQHRGSDPANPGWTRSYVYSEPSLIEDGTGGLLLKTSNRLTQTAVGGTPENYSTGGNGYDAHGNMLRMPHLQVLQWDFKDQLQMTQRQAVNALDADGIEHQGERTWYVYDSSRERIRKVTESASGQIKEERLYFGGFEIYRRNGANPLVRETVHIMDDKHRVAMVETRVQGNEPGVPQQFFRFLLGSHLGSSVLELDEEAQIISYEEYTPYGSTSYQAVRSQTETPKRYRYMGKERDEESGFYYCSARYYVSWVGRWTTADPIGLSGGLNLFAYVRCDPVGNFDPTGTQEVDSSYDEVNQVCVATPIMSNAAMSIVPPDASFVALPTYEQVSIPAVELPSNNVLVRATGNPRPATGSPVATHVQVDPDPMTRGMTPTNPESTALPAEHALGRLERVVSETYEGVDYSYVVQDSPYLAASENIEQACFAEGGIGFEGELYLINQDALPASTQVLSNPEVIQSVQEYGSVEASAAHQAEIYVRNQVTEQEALVKGHVPPEALTPVNEARVTLQAEVEVAPSATSEFLASAAETGVGVLRVAGQILTVVGAVEEANRSVEFERSHNRGELNAQLMGASTLVVGVLAGAVDDAFAAAQVPMMGAPVLTLDSWEQNGSGPVQHAAGEAIRGFLGWSFEMGF